MFDFLLFHLNFYLCNFSFLKKKEEKEKEKRKEKNKKKKRKKERDKKEKEKEKERRKKRRVYFPIFYFLSFGRDYVKKREKEKGPILNFLIC